MLLVVGYWFSVIIVVVVVIVLFVVVVVFVVSPAPNAFGAGRCLCRFAAWCHDVGVSGRRQKILQPDNSPDVYWGGQLDNVRPADYGVTGGQTTVFPPRVLPGKAVVFVVVVLVIVLVVVGMEVRIILLYIFWFHSESVFLLFPNCWELALPDLTVLPHPENKLNF